MSNKIDITYVSIPYGKGKDKKTTLPKYLLSYQFPMGKVKLKLKERPIMSRFNGYQFPMGKVKVVVAAIVGAIVRINSLWER